MVSNLVKCVVIISIVAVAFFIFGLSSSKYLGQEGVEFVNAPAYDSGWMDISEGETITFRHGLGTTEVFVCMIGKNSEGLIHQRRFGGDTGNGLQGVYWSNLTQSSVNVHRCRDDYHPDRILTWNQVRIMIWKIAEP